MALYAFDGTWNEDEPNAEEDTNVVRFKRAYQGTVDDIPGVGTRFGSIGKLFGGLFGTGDLFCFPNDLNSTYGNNSGALHAVVERVS